MKNLEKYLVELETKFPDIKNRLNPGANEAALSRLEKEAGHVLTEEFKELYRLFDGEDMARQTGFFAGFSFLPLEHVLYELSFFREVEDELTAMGTRAIQEGALCELGWIPFAYDSSRAFLAVDLSPADAGKTGQIIAIDYDFDQTYLLADNMDEFFGRMAAWLLEGILIVHTEDGGDAFLMEASGHLLNSIEELSLQEKGGMEQVSLPEGFWQEYYQKTVVPQGDLAKEKRLLIKEKEVDCSLFARMENLKELIFHGCKLKKIGGIAKAAQLKKLIFVCCTFDGEDFSALRSAPALKELSVNKMDGTGLLTLSGLKTLKSLSIRELSGVDLSQLGQLKQLQELWIESMGLHDGRFLAQLKNLKKLDLRRHRMDDLDFLPALQKLTHFHLPIPAKNEDGLLALPELKKLKEFIYPVRDLNIYANQKNLEKVGFAVEELQDYEVFAGSKVNSFTICNLQGKKSWEEIEEIAEKMGQYVKIYSYGQEYV